MSALELARAVQEFLAAHPDAAHRVRHSDEPFQTMLDVCPETEDLDEEDSQRVIDWLEELGSSALH